MAAIKQIFAIVLGAVFAHFFPELAAEAPLPEWFVDFTAFAPLVIFLSAAWNTWQQWRGVKAWAATLIIGNLVSLVAWLLGIGILLDVPFWHVPVYGIGAAAAAISIFNIPMVKNWLEIIFNYEWKKK